MKNHIVIINFNVKVCYFVFQLLRLNSFSEGILLPRSKLEASCVNDKKLENLLKFSISKIWSKLNKININLSLLVIYNILLSLHQKCIFVLIQFKVFWIKGFINSNQDQNHC